MTQSEAPAPFVSADIDVRDLDGFMLNVERLLASELWALSTPEEFKAAVGLWCRAWKQLPGGSLPNDERVLAAFSGAGARWRKVREMALRGFVLCSDGRLYHKVLCEDVVRAFTRKVERRERTRAATEARQRQRDEQRDVSGSGTVTAAVEPFVTKSQGLDRTGRDGTGQDAKEERDTSPSGDVVDNTPGEIGPAESEANGHERPNKRGARLPADWRPGSAEWDFALSLKLDPEAVADEFRDYWCPLPGPKACKLDWPATFRNRCREIAGRTRGNGVSGRPATQSGPITDAVNAIRAQRNLG